MSYQRVPDKIVEISKSNAMLFGLTESGDLYEFNYSHAHWTFIANSPMVEIEDSKVRPPRSEK